MTELFKTLIKAVTGNGTGSLKITPSPGVRLHKLQLQLTYSGGTNTLAALCTALTEIRVFIGNLVIWRLNGTQLRDFMLLNGTTYDFDGLPNTGCQVTIPFSHEWFGALVADSLALDPLRLGGPITVEIDSSASLTCVAYQFVSDDAGRAQSSGIVTLEVIKPVAGGTTFYVENEVLKPRGRLLQLSIYPDSGASNEITPAGLIVGTGERFAHEDLSSAQNDEDLARLGLTPAASGRTANIYDMVFARGDALAHAIDLDNWGSCKLKVQAGSAMSGTCSILVARLEYTPRA